MGQFPWLFISLEDNLLQYSCLWNQGTLWGCTRFMRVWCAFRSVTKGLRLLRKKRLLWVVPYISRPWSVLFAQDSHPPSEHRPWCLHDQRDKRGTLLSADSTLLLHFQGLNVVPGFGPSPGPRVPSSSGRFRCWPIETLGTASSIGKCWKILRQYIKRLSPIWSGCFKSFS